MISTATVLLAEALFVSDLQPSENPDAHAVRAAVTGTLLRLGSDGCAAALATAFGDHPENAVRRMGWVRETVGAVYPARAPQLAG